jgi:DNA repair protein RecN (Recombination protein N)
LKRSKSIFRGLQVIQETGAGKSVIAGALSLVLGERADNHPQASRSTVEAGFAYLIWRSRKISDCRRLDHNQSGRSPESAPMGNPAFVNDTPVNLEQLRRL